MEATSTCLATNLAALSENQPELAERLKQTAPAEMSFAPSKAGPVTASVMVEGKPRALASQYDPEKEADRWVEQVDLAGNACVVVLGLGVGHHVNKLYEATARNGLIVVYEPSSARLRATLEHVDHAAWLRDPLVFLADEHTTRAELTRWFDRYSGIVTQGTRLLTHAPTRQLDAESLDKFGSLVADVLRYCRTQVATTLVNAARTYTNLSMNLAHYAAGEGTDALHNAARGCPAVCVSAGPSLARNVALLADPEIREKVVVITAQTTLKPLLDRGVKPDFVTALDYASISSRFYEGLPSLEDVTLIAEPLANPAILDAYPGPIRVTHNDWLNRLLGDLAPSMIPIRYGATVAHLSVYVAQHLGCDPIILLGQDLAFSDGLYYCPGTAIHRVWMNELQPFNTLENMEWQRIVRHRKHLSRREDQRGQTVFTDEQMTTYLNQFERDFAEAEQQIIDCTEGGLAKAHSESMPLAEALKQFTVNGVPSLPIPKNNVHREKLIAIAERLQTRLSEIMQLHKLSWETMPLLKQMSEHLEDEEKSAKLYEKIQARKKKVDALKDAFNIIQQLNSLGTFKRAQADRKITRKDLSGIEKQQAQIERDLENVRWIKEACEEAKDILTQAMARLRDHFADLDQQVQPIVKNPSIPSKRNREEAAA